MRDVKSVVSEASRRCRDAIPSRRSVSSRDIGWTSLLVDIHDGIAWEHDYTAVTTPDPRIGVSLSGRYVSNYHSRGAWRRDVFQSGTTTVLRTDDARRFRFARLEGPACKFALIYLPLAELEAAADHLRRPGQRIAVPMFNQMLTHDAALTEVAHALIRAMEQGADDFYAETASAWLAAHLLVQKSALGLGDDPRSAGMLSDARLQRAIDFIAAHFSEPITLDRMATEAGVSKYHFTRLFRDKVGQTPFHYLAEVRLAAARQLLRTTGMSVGEIAHACGYGAASSFTAAFSARYGEAPGAFRTRPADN